MNKDNVKTTFKNNSFLLLTELGSKADLIELELFVYYTISEKYESTAGFDLKTFKDINGNKMFKNNLFTLININLFLASQILTTESYLFKMDLTCQYYEAISSSHINYIVILHIKKDSGAVRATLGDENKCVTQFFSRRKDRLSRNEHTTSFIILFW